MVEESKSQGKGKTWREKFSDCLGDSEESELTSRKIWFQLAEESLEELDSTTCWKVFVAFGITVHQDLLPLPSLLKSDLLR